MDSQLIRILFMGILSIYAAYELYRGFKTKTMRFFPISANRKSNPVSYWFYFTLLVLIFLLLFSVFIATIFIV